MAPRSIATGTISFGLVAIPVKLYSSGESSVTVRFNMLHRECGTRVKYRYWCPTDEEFVERSDLAKGYEFAKGQFVLFTDEELKALDPEPTNAIEITEFVPLADVDPIYFEKTYYLGPDKGGPKPYRLLSLAMAEAGRAALARYAARGKNYLVLLRPFGEGLVMQQLRYQDEIRDFDEVPKGDAEIERSELDLALQLLEQTTSESFVPTKYEDEERQRVWELIEKKVQGEEIVAAPQDEPKAQIIDLMEALRASLGADEGPAAAKQSKPAAKKPARKPAKRAAKKTAKKATKRAKAKKS